jgi:two-component system, chemotaxis family, protein-glutamate methylesterase/glutaminase
MSVLPDILARSGRLPATAAVDGEQIVRGQVYVAPSDSHLLVHDGHVALSRGPRENGHRPAIDPLFRSAARSHGRRVVGVILSGMLDDGAAGLRFIQEHGGAAVVQDPEDATYPAMPLAALQAAQPDHVVPLAMLGAAIQELLDEQLKPSPEEDAPVPGVPDRVELDPTEVALVDVPASGLVCPDCGGALWVDDSGALPRFTCQVGHSYSPESLLEEQGLAVERALWAALRALEERSDLLRRLARRSQGKTRGRFELRARDADEHAARLRDVLFTAGRLVPETTS